MPETERGRTMFQPVKCPENCWYLQRINGYDPMCGYFLTTDTVRGCDPGPGCKRYIPRVDKVRGYKSKRMTWDAEKGRKLWEEGYTDAQIAKAVCTRIENVTAFRRRRWGKRNKGEKHG